MQLTKLDQVELYFEHNLPRNKETWAGTFLLIGNSGAGKTYWMVQLFLRYMRQVKSYARRTLIYISPEWDIDKTLKPLKEKRYALNVLGIDVSEKAVRESGLDAAEYYKTKVVDIFEKHGEKAIIVFDDFMDAAPGMELLLRKLYIRGLRTARHKVTSVISLVHSYASGKNTSQATQSVKFCVFFPRSQKSRIVMFMRDHLQAVGRAMVVIASAEQLDDSTRQLLPTEKGGVRGMFRRAMSPPRPPFASMPCRERAVHTSRVRVLTVIVGVAGGRAPICTRFYCTHLCDIHHTGETVGVAGEGPEPNSVCLSESWRN